MKPLEPGATIGILGTGQLGRMLALAAARLGFSVHIYGPENGPPAKQVSTRHWQADYRDPDELKAFASACDVVTFEFENIVPDYLDIVANTSPLRPSKKSLEISQDRLVEKQFLENLALTVAPYAAVETETEFVAARGTIPGDAILKTRRFGYDGKGQISVAPGENDPTAIHTMNGVACVLEERVDLHCEISIVTVRGLGGETATYDAPVNEHVSGILDTSSVGQFTDVDVPAALRAQAAEQAISVANALGHVGILTVEFFITKAGALLINEIAPRVHNSGHWTIDACQHDQFENHIRAIAGWPIGSTDRHSDAQMVNLIGDDVQRLDIYRNEDNASLHIYGKSEAREGRKMGHITRLAPPRTSA